MQRQPLILMACGGRSAAGMPGDGLSGDEFSCRLVRSCQDLIAEVRQERPDLIVAESAMTDAESLALLEWLKHDPATAGIPMLLVIGSNLADERLLRLMERADFLYRWPLTKPQLEQALTLIAR